MFDRNYIKNILKNTLIELAETGNWLELEKSVTFFTKKFLYLTDLVVDTASLKTISITTSNELQSKRKEWHKELKNANKLIYSLKDEYQDEIKNNRMRLIYAEKCLKAKAEVEELNIYKPERVPLVKHENRVHYELNKIFDVQVADLNKAIDFWRFKYSEDIINMNEALAVLREKVNFVTNNRMKLQNKLKDRQDEIDAWLKIKRERDEAIALNELLRRSATRIQSWWRGQMVRRALGFYRYLKNKKPVTKSKSRAKIK